MNRPNKNNFDDDEMYKYIILLEEYTNYLEEENDDLQLEVDTLERKNNRLFNENERLEDELEEIQNFSPIIRGNILDELTREWLLNKSNWEIVKKLATSNEFEPLLTKYMNADPELAKEIEVNKIRL
jgi:FtsZ-binding cell division protein ZapB